MRKTKTRKVALCGLLGALAVSVMLLGGVIPAATFCCPMLAALLLVPVLRECGSRLGLAWYGAVAILCCLLGPDKEAAAVFVFLGWYPIVRPRLHKRPWPVRVCLKLVIFNAAVVLMYAILMFVLRADAIRSEFFGMEAWLLAVLLALGNVTFFLFDTLLPKMELIYLRRLRPRLWREQ